ncbi:MAG: 50S ribosomal protein L31 [Candidatus Adlerbacteria bacterium GW2011_GWC1_50_9]|uniref:50S ribosomal protein L31 n=2 Tax=Parcubacteria group TaxID=1794811 RepID=A0A0G1ZG83_9BACT|nr:MAG: 50S ribosomal protein L31 [Candidatus Adlerbacteria bacterium GW2011_GWC1_50_9]KKW30020.1 MAG: 50S ribosomal protein L31 [Candidatus Kaiserbacteria bacterium GW2011_GWC2_52_8b]
MKKEIHPGNYRPVIFEDSTIGKSFLISSTVTTEKTAKWTKAEEDGSPGQKDLGTIGKEYPVFHVEISSASHPFYTGHSKVIDTAGRVEKFKNRMAASKPKKKASSPKSSKGSER